MNDGWRDSDCPSNLFKIALFSKGSNHQIYHRFEEISFSSLVEFSRNEDMFHSQLIIWEMTWAIIRHPQSSWPSVSYLADSGWLKARKIFRLKSREESLVIHTHSLTRHAFTMETVFKTRPRKRGGSNRQRSFKGTGRPGGTARDCVPHRQQVSLCHELGVSFHICDLWPFRASSWDLQRMKCIIFLPGKVEKTKRIMAHTGRT